MWHNKECNSNKTLLEEMAHLNILVVMNYLLHKYEGGGGYMHPKMQHNSTYTRKLVHMRGLSEILGQCANICT
jgi:hypothetical protein